MGTETGQISRNELIEKNLPLVGYQVAELLRRVPSFVQREDLASAGALALVQAAGSFDPEQGVPFHRYAIYRIRGAMLDELRAMDWATRGARQRTKQLEEMTQTLTAAEGRAPTREELASALGVAVEKVESTQIDAARRLVSIDAASPREDDTRGIELVDEGQTPEDTILDDERMVYLRASVQALPQRLRFVVEQIFFEERPIQDIASEMGVTQSRVSQLRTEALAMMRDGMTHHLEPDLAPEDDEEPTGIVKKRRDSYRQKVKDNAATLRDNSENAEISSQTAPPPQPETTHRKDAAKPDSREVRTSTSATSFLAGRSRSSVAAKAQLHAEEEARLAEQEKHKDKDTDKPADKARGKEPEKDETPESTKSPPTTSYLGGLSIRKQSLKSQPRRGSKKN